jgi:hypothetical protein
MAAVDDKFDYGGVEEETKIVSTVCGARDFYSGTVRGDCSD